MKQRMTNPKHRLGWNRWGWWFPWVVLAAAPVAASGCAAERPAVTPPPAATATTTVPPAGAGRPESGPQAYALVEANVLSAEGVYARLRIDRVREYRADPDATWEPLRAGNQVSVRLTIAKVVPLSEKPAVGGEVAGTIVDVADLSEERIASFGSSLVGKSVVLSMNCAAPRCEGWFEGHVYEIR